MKITVYYDYLCPYCYIGSLRIKRAAGEAGAELEWRGLEIHPEYPAAGLRRKKSTRSALLTDHISELAAEDGVHMQLPGFVTNTSICLQAAEYARAAGVFWEFHVSVYEHYFSRGVNIGDIEWTIRIGESVGLEPGPLERTITSGKYAKTVQENTRLAGESGVLGVPTFIIGSFPLHGVQSIETFSQIISKQSGR